MGEGGWIERERQRELRFQWFWVREWSRFFRDKERISQRLGVGVYGSGFLVKNS